VDNFLFFRAIDRLRLCVIRAKGLGVFGVVFFVRVGGVLSKPNQTKPNQTKPNQIKARQKSRPAKKNRGLFFRYPLGYLPL